MYFLWINPEAGVLIDYFRMADSTLIKVSMEYY